MKTKVIIKLLTNIKCIQIYISDRESLVLLAQCSITSKVRAKRFYLNKLAPDEPLGETTIVVLIFYSDIWCFKLYI